MATTADYNDPIYQRNIEQLGAAHPEWEAYQAYKQSQPGATQPGAPGAAPTAPTANTVPGQAQAAQTYSGTPGAAPTGPTSNQGTQDVVRNSYLQQATQGTNVDRNDPVIRQQSDAYAAGVERQRRQYLAEQAEKGGPYATGAMRGQERATAAQAGQQIGSFEAQLVGRELDYKRKEILNALDQLGNMVNTDQGMALQRELARLDAQMKELGIRSGEGIAGQELGLKRDLGFGGLNLDLMRLLSQDRQFSDDLGLRIALAEQSGNQDWLNRMGI